MSDASFRHLTNKVFVDKRTTNVPFSCTLPQNSPYCVSRNGCRRTRGGGTPLPSTGSILLFISALAICTLFRAAETLLIAGRPDPLSGQCWTRALDYFRSTKPGGDRRPTGGASKDASDHVGYVADRYEDKWLAVPQRDVPCSHFREEDKQMMALILMDCHSNRMDPAMPNMGTAGAGGTGSEGKDTKKEADREGAAYLSGLKNKKLSTSELTIYVAFFNHLESVCFQVYSTLWQASTDTLIESLAGVCCPDDLVECSDESSQLNSRLLDNQLLTLEHQQSLMADSLRLHDVIEGGQGKVESAFNEIRARAEVEKARLNDMFADIYDGLQKMVYFEKYLRQKLRGFHTAALYFALLFLSNYLTNSQRMSAARPKLYLLFSCMAAVEYFWLYSIHNIFKNPSHVLSAQIGPLGLRAIRISFSAGSIATLLHSYLTYRDPHSMALENLANEVLLLRSHIHSSTHRQDPTFTHYSHHPPSLTSPETLRNPQLMQSKDYLQSSQALHANPAPESVTEKCRMRQLRSRGSVQISSVRIDSDPRDITESAALKRRALGDELFLERLAFNAVTQRLKMRTFEESSSSRRQTT